MWFSVGHIVCSFFSFLAFAVSLICLNVGTVTGDHYLVVLMITQGSHVLTTEPVLQSLINRGHDVTLLLPPMPEEKRKKNLINIPEVEVLNTFATQEVITEISKIPKQINLLVKNAAKGDVLGELRERAKGFAIFDLSCEAMLSNTTLISMLRQREFDLMFAEIFLPCPLLLAQSLGIRYTTLTTMVIPADHAAPQGSPINPSYIPALTTGFSNRMTFAQRLINTFKAVLTQSVIARERMGSDTLKGKYDIMPGVSTYLSFGKADIWFINSHFAFDFPRPLVPSAVLVGGLTAKPSTPLNEDLETFMQQSGLDGVVVFSFGSYLKVLEASSAQIIADAFASIPQKVLWKKSGQTPANASDNIKFVEWMPQNDILGHAKTRLFISHCGLNSAFEALYHAVPILCIPVFADQKDVAARVVSRGIGLQISFQTLTTGELQNTIHTILNDKRFQENMNRMSSIYRDEPLMPADRVAYWMEYVVRHNGTSHLQSAAMELNFFQYYLLDVAAFVMLCAVILTVLLTYLAKLIFRQCGINDFKAKSD